MHQRLTPEPEPTSTQPKKQKRLYASVISGGIEFSALLNAAELSSAAAAGGDYADANQTTVQRWGASKTVRRFCCLLLNDATGAFDTSFLFCFGQSGTRQFDVDVTCARACVRVRSGHALTAPQDFHRLTCRQPGPNFLGKNYLSMAFHAAQQNYLLSSLMP